MADCLADLLLHSGSIDHPPVQVTLTVVATAGTLTGGDEPGEIDGQLVPASLLREVAYALGLLPRPDGATSDNATPDAATDIEPQPDGPDQANARDPQTVADLAALLTARTTTGTPLAELPTVALVDDFSGALLALTDGLEIRRVATCGRRACRTGRRSCTHPPAGPGLGPPQGTNRYRPTAPLDRFVRARDRRCRFPGCRARPIRCDLDHVVPWPAGPTSASNLCCLCRHHHRLSHQAPGWTMRRLPDGGIEWTTPGGERLVTHPIPYGTDDISPPGSPPGPGVNRDKGPVVPPLTAVERVIGRPLPPGAVDDDPPPF